MAHSSTWDWVGVRATFTGYTQLGWGHRYRRSPNLSLKAEALFRRESMGETVYLYGQVIGQLKNPELVVVSTHAQSRILKPVACGRKPYEAFSDSLPRSSTRRILPLMVLGSSGTNSMDRGYL